MYMYIKKLADNTCRVFSSGGEGGNLPPLDCCLPPFQIGSNNSVLYFPEDNTPPRPPYHRLTHQYSHPFKISLENTLPVIDLSKTLQKSISHDQAKALSKRSRMMLVLAP